MINNLPPVTGYMVQVELPLSPSYGNTTPEQYKVATKLRTKLQKKLGIKIKLTGSSTFNPNYKVDQVFPTPQTAQSLADLINKEVPEQPDFAGILPVY